MKRVFITGWRDEESIGARTPVEVNFSFRADEAHPWPSKEAAQSACSDFNSYAVMVDWAEGGHYVCKNFQVEELVGSRGFVVFCDGPFTYKGIGSKRT